VHTVAQQPEEQPAPQYSGLKARIVLADPIDEADLPPMPVSRTAANRSWQPEPGTDPDATLRVRQEQPRTPEPVRFESRTVVMPQVTSMPTDRATHAFPVPQSAREQREPAPAAAAAEEDLEIPAFIRRKMV
jgi:hypothetical protein